MSSEWQLLSSSRSYQTGIFVKNYFKINVFMLPSYTYFIYLCTWGLIQSITGSKGELWTEKFKSPELGNRSLGKVQPKQCSVIQHLSSLSLLIHAFMGRGIPNALALCYLHTASWAISCSVLHLSPRRVKVGGSGRQMSFWTHTL